MGGFVLHPVRLRPHHGLELRQRRGDGQLLPRLPGVQGAGQIRRLLFIAIDPLEKHVLRGLGEACAPPLPKGFQPGQDGPDPLGGRVPLAGLQGGDERRHLRLGLLVLLGQEHPGLEQHQVGGHGDELPCHRQVQRPSRLHPGQKLL